jgi:hypothetical protein
MVTSQKKRLSDPYEALLRLMDEPGSSDDVWDDFWGVATTDDAESALARAAALAAKYDDRAAAIVFASILEHALELALSSRFVTETERIRQLFSYRGKGRRTVGYVLSQDPNGGSDGAIRRGDAQRHPEHAYSLCSGGNPKRMSRRTTGMN